MISKNKIFLSIFLLIVILVLLVFSFMKSISGSRICEGSIHSFWFSQSVKNHPVFLPSSKVCWFFHDTPSGGNEILEYRTQLDLVEIESRYVKKGIQKNNETKKIWLDEMGNTFILEKNGKTVRVVFVN